MVAEVRKQKQIVWQDIRPAPKRPIAPPPKKPKKKFRLPKFRLPFIKKIQLSYSKLSRRKKQLLYIGLSLLVCFVVLGIFYLRVQSPELNTPKVTPKVTQLVHGTPDYNTIIPQGKSITDLGGWTRVSPPSSNPVFAFTDKIGTDSITISEQPLPSDFQKDTETHVNQLAQSFNAGEKITLGTVTAYIATTEKGMQRIFLTKNSLLILITSNVHISNDAWAKYITALQ
jgi:hypothetical protein